MLKNESELDERGVKAQRRGECEFRVEEGRESGERIERGE